MAELNRLPEELDGTFWLEDEFRNVAELPVEVREWMARIPRRMWFFARPAEGEPFGLGAWRHVDEYNPPYVRLIHNFCWVEPVGQICYLSTREPMPVDQIDVLPYLIFRAEMLKRSVIAGGHRDRYLRSHRYEFREPNDLDPETLRTGWADFNLMRLSPNHPPSLIRTCGGATCRTDQRTRTVLTLNNVFFGTTDTFSCPWTPSGHTWMIVSLPRKP